MPPSIFRNLEIIEGELLEQVRWIQTQLDISRKTKGFSQISSSHCGDISLGLQTRHMYRIIIANIKDMQRTTIK